MATFRTCRNSYDSSNILASILSYFLDFYLEVGIRKLPFTMVEERYISHTICVYLPPEPLYTFIDTTTMQFTSAFSIFVLATCTSVLALPEPAYQGSFGVSSCLSDNSGCRRSSDCCSGVCDYQAGFLNILSELG